MRAAKFLTVATAAVLCTAARADVAISNKPTSNMSCDAGVCTATAQKAVLNVGELAAMLANGDVTLKTGSVAKDISIDQPISWTSTSRLTLDARQSVIVNKQVTVMGQGNLTVTTNDNGQPKNKSGEFVVVREHGSVQLWDKNSSLIIDGQSFTLVYDIKSFAADVAADPSGFYALAKPYDASADGTFSWSPIPTAFKGHFDGLGNPVSNLTLAIMPSGEFFRAGLFSSLEKGGVVRNVRLSNAEAEGTSHPLAEIGLLVGTNEKGKIEYSSVSGTITINGGSGEQVGGLAADSDGTVRRSSAAVQITMTNASGGVGGLLAVNAGSVTESSSSGSIVAKGEFSTPVGGLIGLNLTQGWVSDAFAVTAVHNGKDDRFNSENTFGGLVGENGGQIATSYAAGRIGAGHSADPDVPRGGLVGTDDASAGSLSNTYWNLDKGISDPTQGAGNISNDPGIIGLTDAQMKSGLPVGFDPRIWGSDPNVNNGYPYLISNPPR